MLALLLACFVSVLSDAGKMRLSEGDKLTKNVLAPYTGTDEYMTEKARRVARERTETVYVIDEAAVGRQESAIESWFTSCEAFMNDMLTVWKNGARVVEGSTLYNDTNWRTLAPEVNLEKALEKRGISKELGTQAAYALLNAYLPTGRVRDKDAAVDISPLKDAVREAVFPVLEAGVTSRSLSSACTKAKNTMKKTSLASALKTELAENLIDRYMAVTVTADETATEAKRAAEAAAVNPVKMVRGQVILKKDTVIDADDIAHLTALGLIKGAEGEKSGFVPLFLYASLSLLGVLLHMVLADKRLILGGRETELFFLSAAVSELIVFLCALWEPQAAPVLLPVLLAGTLLKKEQAATAALFSALLLPILACTDGAFSKEAFASAAAVYTGGMAAVFALSKGAKSPLKIMGAGLTGGAAGALIRLFSLLYREGSTFDCIAGAGLTLFGGLIAGGIAVLLRPVLVKLTLKKKRPAEEQE